MCMSCRVVSDDRPRRTTACVRYYGEPIERAFFFCPPMRGSVLGRLEYRLHGCIVCECMESLCVYIVVHAHRANAFVRACAWARDDGNGWMDGVRAFMSSVVDARGDGRIRETHRARPSTSFASNASLPRLARSLSRTTNSFIHSLIHSFRCERTNERRDERTTGRAREGRERDGLDRRVRSHPIARAREEVRASVSNARRIERIESRVHFKPPIHRRRSRRMRRGINATE